MERVDTLGDPAGSSGNTVDQHIGRVPESFEETLTDLRRVVLDLFLAFLIDGCLHS